VEVDLRRSNVPGGIISQFVSIKQSEVDMELSISVQSKTTRRKKR